jgi:hypothetical protein
MARLRGERGRVASFFTSGDRTGFETAWPGCVASSGNCRSALSVIGAIGFAVMVRCPTRFSDQTATASCQSGVGKLIEAVVDNSATHKHLQGAPVAIDRGADGTVCPVQALRDWLDTSDTQ